MVHYEFQSQIKVTWGKCLLLPLLSGRSLLRAPRWVPLFIPDRGLPFLTLHFRLLTLGRKLHFLRFYFIYNLWKEVEHSCVSLYRILTVNHPAHALIPSGNISPQLNACQDTHPVALFQGFSGWGSQGVCLGARAFKSTTQARHLKRISVLK